MGIVNPIEEIVEERERARLQRDPNVDLCFLATVSRDGQPMVRTLVLRDVGDRGFGLLLSTTSIKWQQIHQPQRYELLILWLTVMRQYRIQGDLAPMNEALVASYWNEKNHGSRLLECYYTELEAQSAPIPSREHLLKGIRALREKYPETGMVPRPEALRGIYLVPQRIEAWHGSEDRLHDRRLYTKTAEGWSEQVLVP